MSRRRNKIQINFHIVAAFDNELGNPQVVRLGQAKGFLRARSGLFVVPQPLDEIVKLQA